MDWPLLGSSLALAVGFGLGLYHLTALVYYWRFYILQKDAFEKWKCQPKRHPREGQVRRAIIESTSAMTVGGIVSGFLVYAIQMGLPTALFFQVSEMGWPYVIGSTVLYFVLLDGGAYYAHRLLHVKPLYMRIHRHHHAYVAPTPWVAAAIHPAELLLLQFTSLIWVFILPMHPGSVITVLVYVLVYNIIDHSGAKVGSMLPWQPHSQFHDDHHAHFHVNFGQHLTLWDRIHGTLRRRGRTYGRDVYGGRGKVGERGSAVAEFVRYR